MSSYCEVAAGHPIHGPFHDREHGFPVREDPLLFERLLLEINQAGLSWVTVLRKREGFRAAYASFDPERVASFDAADRERLLADAGIIRNRLKIDAAIRNAEKLIELRRDFGSFAGWLDAHHPLELPDWVRLFRKTFRFTGGEIVNEFLMGTGYLPGAHLPTCPIHPLTIEAGAPWARTARLHGSLSENIV